MGFLSTQLKRRAFSSLVSSSTLLSATAILTLSGCPSPPQSKSADPTRALAPVPACVRSLPRSGDAGFSAQLPEEEYWGLIVPTWKDKMDAETEVRSCSGVPIFAEDDSEKFRLAPAARMEGRITYGGGANRLKVVWLRSHEADNGLEAGPLALVRVVDNYAEVYGVTSYEGDPERVRFDLERLGGEVVVTAIDDACAGAEGACDTVLRVFRPNAGRLDELAEIGLQRVRKTRGLEPGISGELNAKLVASPEYKMDGIHLIEEFTLTDAVGRSVHRAQVERAYLLEGADVVETSTSLWILMYQSRVESAGPASTSETGKKAAPQTGGDATAAEEKAPAAQGAAESKEKEPSSSSKIAVDELR